MNKWDELVESTIESIHTDSKNKRVYIQLTCVWEGGGRRRLSAVGVDDFFANEMRLSNVVEQVKIFDSTCNEVSDAELADRLFFLMRGKELTPPDLEWSQLLNKMSRIRSGELVLLEVEPIYGVSVLILAEEVWIESIS